MTLSLYVLVHHVTVAYTLAAWVSIPGQPSQYQLFKDKVFYATAMAKCASIGSHLVYMETRTEIEAIYKDVSSAADSTYWIGLIRESEVEVNSAWRWSSSIEPPIVGELLNESNLAPGERTHEHKDRIFVDQYIWKSEGKSAENFYMCEKGDTKATSIPLTNATETTSIHTTVPSLSSSTESAQESTIQMVKATVGSPRTLIFSEGTTVGFTFSSSTLKPTSNKGPETVPTHSTPTSDKGSLSTADGKTSVMTAASSTVKKYDSSVGVTETQTSSVKGSVQFELNQLLDKTVQKSDSTFFTESDGQISSIILGSLGVIIIIGFCVFIVLLDLSTIHRHIAILKRNFNCISVKVHDSGERNGNVNKTSLKNPRIKKQQTCV